MALNVTPAQAKALQAKAKNQKLTNARPNTNKVRKRPEPYHTHCHDCEECFRTEASETRHGLSHGHHRYQLVWTDHGCAA